MYPSQQNATDQTANFFWVLIMIVGSVLLVWFFRPQWIVIPVFDLRLAELDLVRWLFMGWSEIASTLHLPAPSLHELDALQKYVATVNPHKIDFTKFASLNVFMGDWVRYPVMAV